MSSVAAVTTAHYAVARHVGKRKLLGELPTQENGDYLWTPKQNYLRSRTGDSGETPRFAFALTVSGMGAEDLLGEASARIASIWIASHCETLRRSFSAAALILSRRALGMETEREVLSAALFLFRSFMGVGRFSYGVRDFSRLCENSTNNSCRDGTRCRNTASQ